MHQAQFRVQPVIITAHKFPDESNENSLARDREPPLSKQSRAHNVNTI